MDRILAAQESRELSTLVVELQSVLSGGEKDWRSLSRRPSLGSLLASGILA